jgi:ribosome-associated protein
MTAKRPTTARRKTSSSKSPGTTRARPAKSASAAPAARRSKSKTAAPAARKVEKARPTLRDVVLGALSEIKAVDVKALDVRGLTDITDTMVVASGTSDRHVKSIAERVTQRCKEAGFRPYGIEGERDGEWVLLDLQDIVLHVMLPRVREFYALEKLWEGGVAA